MKRALTTWISGEESSPTEINSNRKVMILPIFQKFDFDCYDSLQEGVPLLCVFPAIFSYCRRFGHHQQSASLHAQDTLVRFRSRAGSQSTSPRHFSNNWKQAAIFYYCSETLFLLKVKKKNISQNNINWTSVHNERLLGHPGTGGFWWVLSQEFSRQWHGHPCPSSHRHTWHQPWDFPRRWGLQWPQGLQGLPRATWHFLSDAAMIFCYIFGAFMVIMVIWNLSRTCNPYIHHFSSILCPSSKQKNRSQKTWNSEVPSQQTSPRTPKKNLPQHFLFGEFLNFKCEGTYLFLQNGLRYLSHGGFTMWLFSCGAACHFSTSCRIASDHGDGGLGLGLGHGSPVAGEGTGAAAGAKPDEGSGVGGTAKKKTMGISKHTVSKCFHRFGKILFLFKCAFLEAFGWTVLCDVRWKRSRNMCQRRW